MNDYKISNFTEIWTNEVPLTKDGAVVPLTNGVGAVEAGAVVPLSGAVVPWTNDGTIWTNDGTIWTNDGTVPWTNDGTFTGVVPWTIEGAGEDLVLHEPDEETRGLIESFLEAYNLPTNITEEEVIKILEKKNSERTKKEKQIIRDIIKFNRKEKPKIKLERQNELEQFGGGYISIFTSCTRTYHNGNKI